MDYTNLKFALAYHDLRHLQYPSMVDALCAQALAAIEELEARNQWQPIETAPKGGIKFDVWINWRGRVADVIFDGGVFREFDGMSWSKLDGNPTHWKPMPQPPEQDQ